MAMRPHLLCSELRIPPPQAPCVSRSSVTKSGTDCPLDSNERRAAEHAADGGPKAGACAATRGYGSTSPTRCTCPASVRHKCVAETCEGSVVSRTPVPSDSWSFVQCAQEKHRNRAGKARYPTVHRLPVGQLDGVLLWRVPKSVAWQPSNLPLPCSAPTARATSTFGDVVLHAPRHRSGIEPPSAATLAAPPYPGHPASPTLVGSPQASLCDGSTAPPIGSPTPASSS